MSVYRFVVLVVFVQACRPEAVHIAASDPRIAYTGRFDTRTPGGARFAWAGAQIEARFSGRSLRARLRDNPIEDETRETDFVTVVVDAAAPKTIALREGLQVYTLATGLGPGPHRVLVWKRTEAEVGIIAFEGFVLEPGESLLGRPSMPKRRMEFVGDSITTGYGNEGVSPQCHWSAKVENNYETFGARAARELGASYSAVAYSGKGLTHNYDARDLLTLPALYRRVIPTDDSSPLVNMAVPVDTVVINLGTNDWFVGVPDERRFLAEYQQLLSMLRTRYPKALLISALGPMLADDYPQPQARTTMRNWLKRIHALRTAQGDASNDLIEFWIDPAEGVGCDFHPNVKTHARLGRELASLVRERLSW